MVQCKSFDLDPITSIFNTEINSTEESTSINSSNGTNHLFVKTNKDHPNLPYTVKCALNYSQKIYLGTLSHYLKYLTSC